jgi:hypothetical protein
LDSVGLARLANGPGVAAAGGRATSAWALGSRRTEVGRRPRGCGGWRSGDVGTGSGVVAAGGRATSVQAPRSRRLEVGRRRSSLWGRDGRRSGDVGAGSGVGQHRRVSHALPAGGRATPCLADLSVGGWLPQCRKRMVVEWLSASGERIRRSDIFSVNTFNSKGRYKWDGTNRCETPFPAFRAARQFSRIAPR